MKPHWLFVLVASLAGLAFALVTPPFQSPDEVGHYWRGVTLAHGHFRPEVTPRGPSAEVPKGVRDLVGATWFWSADDLNARYTRAQREAAWRVELQPDQRKVVTFPAFYTPLPSIPGIVAEAIGYPLRLRPLFTFYLGRLLTVAVYVTLVATAIAITPIGAWAFCVAGSMPMALFVAGSWSTDPVTIGVVFLLIALVLRAAVAPKGLSARLTAALVATALAVGLCKGAYAPVALLAAGIPAARLASRRRAFLVLAAMGIALASGVAMSASVARRNFYVARPDVAVDPARQLDCVRNAPGRFAAIVASDIRHNGRGYVEQMVGRLGWLNVPLPGFAVLLELGALLVATAGAVRDRPWPVRMRVLAAAAFGICVAAIFTSQYLAWTPICAPVVEGVQGRYFLPLLPILIALGASRVPIPERVMPFLVAATAAIANAAGVAGVIRRFY